MTDAGGLTFETVKTITIWTAMIRRPPSICLPARSPKTMRRATVALLSGVDQDAQDSLTYELVAAAASDTDNAAFTIVDNALKLVGSADFETKVQLFDQAQGH